MALYPTDDNEQGSTIFTLDPARHKLCLKDNIQIHLCMTISPDGEALENSLHLDNDTRLAFKDLQTIAAGTNAAWPVECRFSDPVKNVDRISNLLAN